MVRGLVAWLLVSGCEVQIGGTGYHRLPPYFWPIPQQHASCTRRGSADEVWSLFWPSGAAGAIHEFEAEVEGRWIVRLDCGGRHSKREIVVGPSRRSDFGLLNGGCAEVADGEVPGRLDGREVGWDVLVRRGGRLEVGSWVMPRPRSVRWERTAPSDVQLHYVGGRWQRRGCEVDARRVAP